MLHKHMDLKSLAFSVDSVFRIHVILILFKSLRRPPCSKKKSYLLNCSSNFHLVIACIPSELGTLRGLSALIAHQIPSSDTSRVIHSLSAMEISQNIEMAQCGVTTGSLLNLLQNSSVNTCKITCWSSTKCLCSSMIFIQNFFFF